MNPKTRLLCAAVAAALFAVSMPAAVVAKNSPPAGQSRQAAASDAVVATESSNLFFEDAVIGPKEIDLGEQGKLKLPKGMMFVGKEQANMMMEAMGNGTDSNRYGIVFPENQADSENGPDWFADITYDPSGYIKDEEAKDWDTAHMLDSLKEGTLEQNKIRVQKGLPELETNGWIEAPHYDAANHQLIWSIDVHNKKPEPNDKATINYNTFKLGREGYINLTLVTDVDKIAQYKPVAQELLTNITFKEGKTYADFNPSTDKIAEYGLAALVGGVAAKKLGLLAVIAAFFAKFFKLIIVGVVAVGAVIRKLFKRKSE